MTDNEKFSQVSYSRFDPDKEKQRVVDSYVGGGKPWLLLSAYSTEDGLGLDLEAGGGLPLELVENMLVKALTAFKQGQESSTD